METRDPESEAIVHAVATMAHMMLKLRAANREPEAWVVCESLATMPTSVGAPPSDVADMLMLTSRPRKKDLADSPGFVRQS
jgi:hypothetical protein